MYHLKSILPCGCQSWTSLMSVAQIAGHRCLQR